MLGALLAAGAALAIDYPQPDGMVTDLAELLPADLEEALEQKVVAYKAQTTIEIAVVTVPTLQGADPCAYAQELWNQWGVGNAQDNNGVMLLVAPSESKNCIATGYGIEPYFTDLETARVRTEIMRPLNRTEKRVEAIEAGVDAIIAHLGETPWAQRTPPAQADEASAEASVLIFVFVFAIFVLIFVLWMIFSNRRRRGSYSGGYSSSSYDYSSGGGYGSGGYSSGSSSSGSSDSGGSFSGGDSGGGGSGGSD